jgi:GNAT superfamily N-acetyltransferase
VYERWLADPANALWLAYEKAQPVASMSIGPANPEACAVIQDSSTASIIHAFTQEGSRGKGFATVLLDRCLEWARTQGYGRCAVDFETMNYLGARFWLRWFQPVCFSLLRSVPVLARGCEAS